jgi:hypothetical protein
MARVWTYSQQSGGSLLLMLALADFANDAGECWPSIPVLAHKARLTEREIRYLLPKLEQAGELRLDRSKGGRNRRNRYLVTIEENPENISLKQIQGNNFTEICDTKTLKPTSGALNHHRTVNNTAAKATHSFPTERSGRLTRSDPAALASFEQFYQAYPRHVGRKSALAAWVKLSPNPLLTQTIIAAAERYAEQVRDVDERFILHPITWITQERWTDEPLNNKDAGNRDTKPELKDIGNGMVEVEGLKMTRETYERKYVRAAN